MSSFQIGRLFNREFPEKMSNFTWKSINNLHEILEEMKLEPNLGIELERKK
jgi:hypothetical protein